MQSEKVKFARRHLYRVAAVGAAALLAKTVLPKPAKACTTPGIGNNPLHIGVDICRPLLALHRFH